MIYIYIHVVSAMNNIRVLLFGLSIRYISHASDIVEQHLVLFASETSILN